MSNKIRISAFGWAPSFAQGLVRDLRVRWALEEAGLEYDVMLVDQKTTETKEYLALHPFGLVPIYQEGDLTIFESGAILMHIAEKSPVLMSPEPKERARVQSWMFAALNTLELHMINLAEVDLFCRNEEWAKLHRADVVESMKNRLQDLSNWLEGKDYLEGRFSVADLLMTTILRIPRHTNIIAEMPTLEAYRVRCENRPAFQKALAAQMETFVRHKPAKA